MQRARFTAKEFIVANTSHQFQSDYAFRRAESRRLDETPYTRQDDNSPEMCNTPISNPACVVVVGDVLSQQQNGGGPSFQT